MTGRRSLTRDFPADQKFDAGDRKESLPSCNLLHGEPQRCEGWVCVKMKKVAQRVHYFAKLRGPLLELRDTESSPPVIEIDLMGATVQQHSRQRDRATRITLRTRHLTFYFADDRQHVTWQRKLIDGARRRIEEYYKWSEKVIYEGEYATVVHAVEIRTARPVAIKVVDRQASFTSDARKLKMLENEIAILRRVSHPHLIAVWDVFETSAYLYIVLEYAAFGTLESLMISRVFSAVEIRTLMFQLCSALHYLHCKGFVHRDVKPENILITKLDPLTCKLADLGFTDTFVGKKLDRCLGTLPFLSPESLKRQSQGPSVDMWACGVILFILLFDEAPFSSDAGSGPREVSRGLDPRHDDRLQMLEPNAASLIRGLLQLNPLSRLSAQGALSHPFITGPTRFRTRLIPTFKSLALAARFYSRLSSLSPDSEPSVGRQNASHSMRGRKYTPKKYASFYHPRNGSAGIEYRDELGVHVRRQRQPTLLDMSNLGVSLDGIDHFGELEAMSLEKKRPRSMQKLRRSTGRGTENATLRKKSRKSWQLDGIHVRRLAEAFAG